MTYKRRLLPDEIRLLPAETIDVFKLFMKAGKEIYLVGAGVRAILLEQVPENCDFTTNANPDEILAITAHKDPFYDNPFGTVSFPLQRNGKKEIYEITPYRTEQGYSDNRRPDQVKFGTSLEEDVKRRDFTMNAVLVGPQKDGYEMIDFLGGIEDFENKTIKAVGNADERFKEDALRMMRGVRFAARLSFFIEPTTLEAITKNADLLVNISKERIREELVKIMSSSHPADGIHLLTTTGLMKNIIPEVYETRDVPQTGHHVLDVYNHMLESLRNCPSSDPIIRLATFLHDIGKPRTRRLRCIRCGFVMKEDARIHEAETAKLTAYKCPRCSTTQSEHEAGTFYGHEVVGSRMAEEIARRLRFSNKEIERIARLIRWHMFGYTTDMTDASIRRFIKRVGPENISDLLLLRIGDRKGGGSKTTSWRLNELQQRIGEQLYEPMTVSDMAVNGNDVMEVLKVKPSPIIGKIINSLFEEIIEDTSKNNREYLLGRIKELGTIEK